MVLGIAWSDPVQCNLSVPIFGGLLSHGGRMLGEDRQVTHGSLSWNVSIIAPQIELELIYDLPQSTPRALLAASTDVIESLASSR
jgi:hypothetical protein